MLADAGVYFDPLSSDSIADVLRELIGDRPARGLAHAARRRAADFSWRRCASETLSFIAQVATRAGEDLPTVHASPPTHPPRTDMFNNKTLLITGGTGSFGNAVLRRFLDSELPGDPHLSAATRRSRTTCASVTHNAKLKFYIGDVRDCAQRVLSAMRGVDFVFHAAALKQVPSCEFHPHARRSRPMCWAPRTCSKAAIAAGVEAGRLPEHRQGGLSDQRHGHLQGDDGEGRRRASRATAKAPTP